MSVSASPFVCVSVREHISGTARSSPYSLCLLPVAVAALRYVMYFRFYGRRHICTQWAIWRLDDTVSDVMCTLTACCVVLDASCSKRRQAPRLDESILYMVQGTEPAMHLHSMMAAAVMFVGSFLLV